MHGDGLIQEGKARQYCPVISYSGVCLVVEQRYSFLDFQIRVYILGEAERLVL